MTAPAPTVVVEKPASALSKLFDRNRKFTPLAATILVFFIVYFAVGYFPYPVQTQDGQYFFNLLDYYPFLVLTVVGETFVILTGGIDLSVSGILALSSVIMASLLQQGYSPWAGFPIVIAVGMIFGLVMGIFITYFTVQPFIATLAGMWLARGICYMISDAEITIRDNTYTQLAQTKLLIPIPGFDLGPLHFAGLSNINVLPKTGEYITYSVLVALVVLAFGLYLAHFTKFGRTVYAIGGNSGANEQSARMMGLPVNRTKVLVYVFSGFCSALAGITYSIYVMSGRGNHGTGFELTTIAACVIGGVSLSGGEGYLFGALMGVLVTSMIQLLLIVNGQASAYWAYLFIGGLMLLFIGVQSLVAAWNEAAVAKARYGGKVHRPKPKVVWYKTGKAKAGFGGVAGVVAVALFATVVMPFVFPQQQLRQCTLQTLRTEQQKTLSAGGAVIVYERNGGTSCVDELYAVYSDGKVVKDYNNGSPKTEQLTSDQVTKLLGDIEQAGFFSPALVATMHQPCSACYTYNLTITNKGQTKFAAAVDGTTDTSDQFWNTVHLLAGTLNVGK